MSYGNYADHATVTTSPQQQQQQQQHQQQQPSSPLGGYVLGTNGASSSTSGAVVPGGLASYTHTSPGLLTSSQHSLYPSYGDYDAGHDAPDGVHGGFSPAYTKGFSNHNLKASSGSLPLSLHVNSRGNGSVTGNTTSTIPRLGIPVDHSQYIVPPRTQVMQGALATHV